MTLEQLGKRNGRRISRLLAEVVAACRAQGLSNPRLFFEPESAAIFVLDGDHPHYVNSSAMLGERQEAIVARIPVKDMGASFDAGAW